MQKKQKGQHHSKDDGAGGKGKEPMSVSARKLAATLWEINEVPELEGRDSKTREEVIPSNLPDPPHSPISEVGLFHFFCCCNLTRMDIVHFCVSILYSNANPIIYVLNNC